MGQYAEFEDSVLLEYIIFFSFISWDCNSEAPIVSLEILSSVLLGYQHCTSSFEMGLGLIIQYRLRVIAIVVVLFLLGNSSYKAF